MSDSSAIHRLEHAAMNTTFEIRIAGVDAEYATQAARACCCEIDRLEALLSRFHPDSDIAALNRLAPGEHLRLDIDTTTCLRIALACHVLTDGAFDPGLGDVSDRQREKHETATPSAIRGHLLLASDAPVALVDGAPVRIDLGAIGKGYALDVLAERLADWDIERWMLVCGGGSSVLAGAGPGPGKSWRVGIGDREIALEYRAISASGIAEQGHHIIDPRTRRPAHGPCRTWAICASAAWSDALSTAAMLLDDAGREQCCREAGETTMAILDQPDAPLRWFGTPVVTTDRHRDPSATDAGLPL
jgi:thiamine biosynthesis lipoprotein